MLPRDTNITFDNPFGSCSCIDLCGHTERHSYLISYQRILQLLAPKKIFEWGPGENTKVALSNGAKVVSVESEKQWLLDTLPNLTQILVQVADNTYPTLHGHDDCDIYFVDGRRRQECIDHVCTHATNQNHIVFLHDAQRERYHDPLKLYRYVRFLGYGNAVACNEPFILDW